MNKKMTVKMAYMTPEERLERRLRVKRYFVHLVYRVINNKYWLNDVEDTEITDDVNKNLAILKRKKTENFFTLLDKKILNLNPKYRNDEEKLRLRELIDMIRCFKEYPPHVKQGLSECCRFAYFPPHRTIFRQGHPAEALYVIVTGEVSVLGQEIDPITEEMKYRVTAILISGNMVGSGSLMYNTKRSQTVITNDHTQFLVVTKEDFNAVLRSTVQEQWDEITKYMQNHRLFSDWNYKLVKRACMLSSIKKFNRDEEIVNYLQGSPYYSYIILEGCCRVLEHMLLQRVGKQYKLYWDPQKSVKKKKNNAEHVFVVKNEEASGKVDEIPSQLPENVSVYVLEVCQLRAGVAFGFSENMDNRRIMAMSETVKCLCIPRCWVTMQNSDNRWLQYSIFLNRTVPNSEEVLKSFNIQRRWQQYKKSLANEILKKRKYSSGTLIDDIPLSLRIKHQDI